MRSIVLLLGRRRLLRHPVELLHPLLHLKHPLLPVLPPLLLRRRLLASRLFLLLRLYLALLLVSLLLSVPRRPLELKYLLFLPFLCQLLNEINKAFVVRRQ